MKGIVSRGTALRPAALLLLAALALASLSACQSDAATAKLHRLTLGLTYIPDIQFAPFYAAEALGYYRAAGLDVTLHHHGFTEGEFDAIQAGHEDAIFASGDETLQARAQGIPLTYVATVYTRYPVTLIVPASSSIQTAADLRGHRIGIPGFYGATYIGLLAILQSAGLSKSDVNIQAIGFTQAAALVGHKVDAVMGYINNEPVQLQKAGLAIRTIPVTQPLVSDGLAALDGELRAHPDDIRALVKATLQGVRYVLAHPAQAVEMSKQDVPGLDDPAKAANARTVLDATLPLWQTAAGTKQGYSDPAAWQAMESFLESQGQLKQPMDVSSAFSNTYLPS
jgi:NitT/TauT family transport system substrate-binding protein